MERAMVTQQNKYADENYVLFQIRTPSKLKFKSHYPLSELRISADALNTFDQCCIVSGANYCVTSSFCGIKDGSRQMLLGYMKEQQSKIDASISLMKKYNH